MRDDCISERESKVFELRSEKPQRSGSRNEEVQCLCRMEFAFRPMTYAVQGEWRIHEANSLPRSLPRSIPQ
jgi:hypothetical protein